MRNETNIRMGDEKNQRACYAKVVTSKNIKQLIIRCLNHIEWLSLIYHSTIGFSTKTNFCE